MRTQTYLCSAYWQSAQNNFEGIFEKPDFKLLEKQESRGFKHTSSYEKLVKNQRKIELWRETRQIIEI